MKMRIPEKTFSLSDSHKEIQNAELCLDCAVSVYRYFFLSFTTSRRNRRENKLLVYFKLIDFLKHLRFRRL